MHDIVKARDALAGIDGVFAAHSLRSDFVTEAGHQKLPLTETMAMTGHRSAATGVEWSGVFQERRWAVVPGGAPDGSATAQVPCLYDQIDVAGRTLAVALSDQDKAFKTNS